MAYSGTDLESGSKSVNTVEQVHHAETKTNHISTMGLNVTVKSL